MTTTDEANNQAGSSRNPDTATGIIGTIAAVTVAALIAWLASDGGARAGGIPVMVLCAVFAFAVQWLVFVHAWTKRTEHYFDLTGSLTYIVMVIAAVTLTGATDVRSLTIALLILVWALRLGPFLFRRVKNAGEDRRFRSLKQSFPMFLMTWTLQGTWVFVTACCALAALTSGRVVAPDAWFVLGLVLWVLGFAIEVVADNQKTRFRADPANAQRYITSGLWAWSRHPNYFGEIVLWLGIALMAVPTLAGWQFVTLISPVFVVVLLTFISGVRMLENRADKRWGNDPDYQAYKRDTPVLMLWFPKRAAG